MRLKSGFLLFLIIIVSLFSACSKNNSQAPAVVNEEATPSQDLETDGTASETYAGNGANDYPKEMFVNSPDGLRIRNSPDINGERIGLLPHLAGITVISEDANDVTIDNIRGKWVLMRFTTLLNTAYGREGIEGWVFNGYLNDWSHDDYQKYLNEMNLNLYIKSDNAQKITGDSSPDNNWTVWAPGNGWTVYYFGSDGKYSSGLLETSFGTNGIWQIKDNLLYLSEIESGDHEPQVHEHSLSYVYQFTVFGNSTLLLKSVNQEDKSTQIFFKN